MKNIVVFSMQNTPGGHVFIVYIVLIYYKLSCLTITYNILLNLIE